MTTGEPSPGTTRRAGAAPTPERGPLANGSASSGWVIETEVSPFHCLYQDALYFHSQSRLALPRSEGEASRLARAALLLYVASAEALVHQAAVELGRPELASIVADPSRPLPLLDAWRLLPAILGAGPGGAIDPAAAPWPQFAELLALRESWAYPGPPESRRAYYRSPSKSAPYEPLLPHQVPPTLPVAADCIHYPRTGLPRDPYALRPDHLDTARGVLDAAIEALDRRLDGALTRDNRHRREPVRLI
jgi:hypothetical protein